MDLYNKIIKEYALEPVKFEDIVLSSSFSKMVSSKYRCQMPTNMNNISDMNFKRYFYSLKVDGVSAIANYENGWLYLCFRNDQWFKYKFTYSTGNFIAVVEFTMDELVVIDCVARNDQWLGNFISRTSLISAVGRSLIINGKPCRGQDYYSFPKLLQWKLEDIKEGIVMTHLHGIVDCNGRSIFKWKRKELMSVDLELKNTKWISADGTEYGTNIHMEDGIYEFNLRGYVLRKREKSYANDDNTIREIMMCSNIELDDIHRWIQTEIFDYKKENLQFKVREVNINNYVRAPPVSRSEVVVDRATLLLDTYIPEDPRIRHVAKTMINMEERHGMVRAKKFCLRCSKVHALEEAMVWLAIKGQRCVDENVPIPDVNENAIKIRDVIRDVANDVIGSTVDALGEEKGEYSYGNNGDYINNFYPGINSENNSVNNTSAQANASNCSRIVPVAADYSSQDVVAREYGGMTTKFAAFSPVGKRRNKGGSNPKGYHIELGPSDSELNMDPGLKLPPMLIDDNENNYIHEVDDEESIDSGSRLVIEEKKKKGKKKKRKSKKRRRKK